MDSKSWIYALAASGLVASAVQKADPAAATPQKKKDNVECFGINTCKGSNGCGVGTAQAELAIKTFGEKTYHKTAELVRDGKKLGECSGSADGGKDQGYLGWVKKDSKEACVKAGGFVYLKDKAGNLQIEDKAGVRK